MKLDIATLSFILFISSIIQMIGLYFQTKLNKSFSGTQYWVFGNVLNVIGVLLFFIKPFISNKFISIVLANALVILAQILIYIGITLFIDKKVKYKAIISIFLISMSAIFYFTYINDNINCRTIISSIAIASNSLLIAFELLRDKKTSIKISANFLGSVLLFYGAFYVIRSVSTLFYNINSFFDPSIIQSSVLVISICVSYLYSFGLLIMVNQRVRSEERETQERFQTIANYTANLEMWIGVKGELIWINPAFKKFTDYSPEEFMAMPDFLGTLVFKSDLPKVREKYNSALNNVEESGSDF